MAQHSILTTEEFRTVLTPQTVRQIQILQLALTAAPVVFFGGAIALSLMQVSGKPVGTDTVPVLSALNGFLALLSYAGAYLLPAAHFSPKRVRAFVFAAEGPSQADRSLILIRNAAIIRLAILEGSALFGVAVCLVAVTSGALESSPEYWLNALPVLVLLIASQLTFPTEERLARMFEQRIASVPGS